MKIQTFVSDNEEDIDEQLYFDDIDISAFHKRFPNYCTNTMSDTKTIVNDHFAKSSNAHGLPKNTYYVQVTVGIVLDKRIAIHFGKQEQDIFVNRHMMRYFVPQQIICQTRKQC